MTFLGGAARGAFGREWADGNRLGRGRQAALIRYSGARHFEHLFGEHLFELFVV